MQEKDLLFWRYSDLSNSHCSAKVDVLLTSSLQVFRIRTNPERSRFMNCIPEKIRRIFEERRSYAIAGVAYTI
jgi:hypothetical protein